MKDTSIEGTVLRKALRVLKEMNLFQYLICTYSHSPRSIISWVIKRIKRYNSISCASSSDNPFSSVDNYSDVVNILKKMERGHDGTHEKVVQMTVMDCTNSLLHYCLERNLGKNGYDIGKIGELIFNESCKELLGDGFKDLTDSSPQQLDAERYEKLLDAIRNDYMHSNEFLEAMRERMYHQHYDDTDTIGIL